MKHTFDIVIEAPLNVCVGKFNLLNLKHWQRNLESVEHIYGVPGEFGAKMKLNYKCGKNYTTVIETITHKNLPHEFHCNYDSEGMLNIQENFFMSTSENYTKWTNTNKFIPLNSKMRLMLWLMPQTFKKESLQYMKDFKSFVIKEIPICAN